jgi:hypothetical protein
MFISLEDVLKKAQQTAAQRGPLPGVAVCIQKIELENAQQLFYPPKRVVPPSGLRRVALGGIQGRQKYLNVDPELK